MAYNRNSDEALGKDLLVYGCDFAPGPDCTAIQCTRCKKTVTIENWAALPEIGWCGCNKTSAG